jgi:hypothetical protein
VADLSSGYRGYCGQILIDICKRVLKLVSEQNREDGWKEIARGMAFIPEQSANDKSQKVSHGCCLAREVTLSV